MNLVISGWLALGVLVLLVWLSRHVGLSLAGRRVAVLASGQYAAPNETAPTVSVIIAAKDEEEVVETCVATLLKQDYPHLQLILVNDRSTDRTADILARFQAAHPDLIRVVTVGHLPDGWSGKANAMCQGVERATGEYLLFSDADCEYLAKDMITVACRYAQDQGVEFLSVLPIVEPSCFWESVIQPVCTGVLLLWHRPEKVNDPACPTAYANGAFMLVTRGAYDRIGGHAGVAHVMCEDLQLARNAKAAGVRLQVVQNRDLYKTRMYPTFVETWRGWRRILTGSLRRPARVLTAMLLLMLFSVFPWLSLAGSLIGWAMCGHAGSWPWTWLLAVSATAVVAKQSVLARLYRLMQAPLARSLLWIVGALLCQGILLDTLLKGAGLGSTTWRGTSYRRDQPASHAAGSTREATTGER